MDRDEVVFTREQLYEEVWKEPMWTLAPKYGLSDVGLAKICRRLKVPVPGRGYWRQKEVGRKVRRPALRKLPAGATREMEELRLRRNSAGSAIAEPSGPVAAQKRFEALDENRIVVPDILDDPHPLVARSVKTLRGAKKDHQGYLKPKTGACLGVRVTLDSVDRAMCIYDALLKALEHRGYAPSLKPGDEAGTIVCVGEEDVDVVIEEKVEQVTQEGTTARRPYRYRYGNDDEWRPTGRLVLRMDHPYLDGIRRSWGDGKQQRVEDCLNAFMVGLVAVAEVLQAKRLEREAWEREWREAEARRAEEAQRREEEAARVRALDAALTSWQRSRLVRAYVAEFRRAAEVAGNLDDGSELAAWLAWAERYADQVDPLLPQPAVPEDPGRPNRFGYR